MDEVSDLLARIHCNRILLLPTHPDLEDQLIRWGMKALGMPDCYPLPSWREVRQALPPEALIALDKRLSEMLRDEL